MTVDSGASGEPARTGRDERFVRLSRGGHLRCRAVGPEDGTPLLLIRPLGGTIQLWDGLIAHLRRNVRIVTFDPAGVGGSNAAPRCTVSGLAEDALAVLDAFGLSSAAVCGQSLGGFVALHLAARWPARITQLMLISTAKRGAAFSRVPFLPGLLSARCLLRAGADVEVCLLHHTLHRDFLRRFPQEVRAIEQRLRSEPTSRATIVLHDIAAALYAGADDVRRVICPRVVVAGGDDHLLGTSPQEALARALSTGAIVLPGVGHDVSLEAPRALARILNASLPGAA
jgi:pimeloyl-ACP methyl ester carboxylesterase